MPFKSKAQNRFFRAAEARGDMPKGTANRWAAHTKDISKLPEKADDTADGKCEKMSAAQLLAHEAYTDGLVVKFASTVNMTPDLVRQLADDCGMPADRFVKAAVADPEDFIRYLKIVTSSDPAAEMAKVANAQVVAQQISQRAGGGPMAASPPPPAPSPAAAGPGAAPSPMPAAPGGAVKRAGMPMGAMTKSLMEQLKGLWQNASMTTRGAAVATPLVAGGGGYLALRGRGTPPAAPSTPAPTAPTPPASPASQGATAGMPSAAPTAAAGASGASGGSTPGQGMGAGTAAVLGGAAGLGGGLLLGKSMKKKKKPQEEVKEAVAREAILRLWHKRAAEIKTATARAVMLSHLDALAGKLPIEKTANLRVIQKGLAEGKPLVDALREAFPKMAAEQRGWLLAKLVKSAADQYDRAIKQADGRELLRNLEPGVRQALLLGLMGATASGAAHGGVLGGLVGGGYGAAKGNTGKGIARGAGRGALMGGGAMAGGLGGAMAGAQLGGPAGMVAGGLGGAVLGGYGGNRLASGLMGEEGDYPKQANLGCAPSDAGPALGGGMPTQTLQTFNGSPAGGMDFMRS